MKYEFNLLSDNELNAVAGGIWNDPERTAMIKREYASAIAASKGLGNTPGGDYVGNTATTDKAGWNHF
jgi:bacteriocin-like protein